MKTKSKHLHSETSGVFSNAISHSFNQLFPVAFKVSPALACKLSSARCSFQIFDIQSYSTDQSKV